MPKSQLDWFGIVSLWVGTVVMAIKAGGLPLMPGAPSWLSSEFWNYVPLVLVSVYLVIAIFRALRPATPSPSSVPARSATHPLLPLPQAGERDGRVFLSANADPLFLMKIPEGKTSIHSEKAVEPYLGKWLRYKGNISNVSSAGKSRVIWFKIADFHHVYGQLTEPGVAEALHIGDMVEIVGRIVKIKQFDIELADVEIVTR